MLLLLLLLSCFSRVRLCATPLMAAHQAPPSLGFSRQEHWSGLPFPFPMHGSEKWKWSRLSCLTLSDSMDCSLPGSSVHGIFPGKRTGVGCRCLLHTLYTRNEYFIFKKWNTFIHKTSNYLEIILLIIHTPFGYLIEEFSFPLSTVYN